MSIPTRLRIWCGFLAGFAVTTSLGIALDRRPYSAPIFQTVANIMPWPCWSATWAIVAVWAAAAAITGRPWAWRASSVAAIAVASTWVIGISWEHWVDGAAISWTGLALWGWFLATNAHAALAPHAFTGGDGGRR